MSRSVFLRGGAAAVGLGAASGGTSGCSDEPEPCRRVTRMDPVTGPGVTTRFRMEATDLGAPAVAPDGRILFIFGDTFEDAIVGGGFWRSPVGLFADADAPLDDGIVWTSAVGGETAEQLVDYEHDDDPVSTILPGDVLTIGETMYVWVMVNHGFGNVGSTEIWTSEDSGETWERTAEMFDGDHLDGYSQQATWCLHPDDGHVYLLTTGFQRDKEAILQRVPAESILDPDAYETWGEPDGGGDAVWGNPPTPVIEGEVGEMCLRIVDDRWLLSWFNAGGYRADLAASDEPTGLADAEAVTILQGGEWGDESDDVVAQLYGPYIVPGSTLDVMHLVCSQWHTGPDWPYHVEQFRIENPLQESCAD